MRSASRGPKEVKTHFLNIEIHVAHDVEDVGFWESALLLGDASDPPEKLGSLGEEHPGALRNFDRHARDMAVVGVPKRSSKRPEGDRLAVGDEEGLACDADGSFRIVEPLLEAMPRHGERGVVRRRVGRSGVLRSREVSARDGAVGKGEAGFEVGDGSRRCTELGGGEDVGVDDVVDMNKVEEMLVLPDLEGRLTGVERFEEARDDLPVAGSARRFSGERRLMQKNGRPTQ